MDVESCNYTNDSLLMWVWYTDDKMLHDTYDIPLYLQGRSACGVTRSLRTAAIRWWSSLSEPSCILRTANSSTSSAPESQVKYRSYICTQPEPIKNGCEAPLNEKCLRDGGEEEYIRLSLCLHWACAWFIIVRMNLCVWFILNNSACVKYSFEYLSYRVCVTVFKMAKYPPVRVKGFLWLLKAGTGNLFQKHLCYIFFEILFTSRQHLINKSNQKYFYLKQ